MSVECNGGSEGGFDVELLNLIRDAVSEHLEELALVLVILLGVATVLFTVLNWQVSRLLRRYRTLVRGTRGESLEGVLEEYNGRVKDVERDLGDLRRSVEAMNLASRRHLQGLGIVRFNAFENIGGNQSFAIALVDGEGNGVVFSSIYGRDETRVYAKPVEQGASPFTLSSEEQMAVDRALQGKR